jgi:hypothetical protein
MNTGDPWRYSSGAQPGDIRKRNFTGSARESELPVVPLVSQGEHNLGRGKRQYFHRISEEGKEIAVEARNSRAIRELQRKLYQRAKQEPTGKASGRR